jgi:hypothetical protein
VLPLEDQAGRGKCSVVTSRELHAPISTKNREQQRDPEMHQTKKGKQWYFGMKAHVGVDSKTKIIHTAVATVRFGGAARSVARRRNASVGRSGLSRTERSDPGVGSAAQDCTHRGYITRHQRARNKLAPAG